MVRASRSPGEVVLDTGCGTGLLSFAALDLVGTAGRVIGVDVSDGGLAEMAEAAEHLMIGERLELRLGSVLDLPLSDGSVDVVVDRSVLMYVDDKLAAAREYRRVLRSGGRVSIVEPINARARWNWGFDLEPIRPHHERVEAVRAHERTALAAMVGFDERDLADAFEKAGFAEVEIEAGLSEYVQSSGEAWRRRVPGASFIVVGRRRPY